MSRNGGYTIFNLGSTPRTSGTAFALDGAYGIAASPYGKATLISGLVVGDAVYPDFYAPFVPGDSSYVAKAVIGSDTVTIAVTEDDNVTVTVA